MILGEAELKNMNTIPSSIATHLEIGLSREDQARIDELRASKAPKPKGKGIFTQINDVIINLTKVKLKEKVMFFQLLAVMINAGVPIIRSLYVLSEQMNNLKLKKIIRSIALEMEEGKTLSVSMERFASVFGEAERGMIASGEASGNLNSILKDIAKQTEKNAIILAKVKGAMIYPASIFSIMLVSLFLMLTMVVPKLTDLFTEGGKELPTSTKILMAVSEWSQDYWPSLIVIAVVAFLGFSLLRRDRRGRYSIDLALVYLPIFGKLVRELMISRFARMLASLMNSGVPIVKALEINANAVGNEVYKRRIQYAAQDVSQGIPLGENLNQSGFLFPSAVASMVLVGEQTANLTEVAGKIADFYEGEVDNAVASLSKLMEPVILVVMGSMVGFIVAAIMQPIMSLSDISTSV